MEELVGFPRGWFVIAFAEDLAPGDVTSVTYFGRRLVVFRGAESKRVHVLDAYCPHLGADLGVGGTVVDDTVRCPFHAWRFGSDGRCVEIPYAKKIPKKACVEPWPVDEKNGLVFVWHDPEGGAPDYEIPVIAEHGAPGWTGWHSKLIEIKTHPKEIVENVADRAHFPEVHGTHVDEFENEFIDHMAIQRTKGIAYPRGGGTDKIELTATYYGPGYQITEMVSRLPNRLLNSHTPVDENTVHLRFGVMIRDVGDDDKTKAFADAYVKNLQIGYEEDIAIWENKRYRPRPTLCDGDGAIGKLRKWYAQFYRSAEQPEAETESA